jgi:hypothetical protein
VDRSKTAGKAERRKAESLVRVRREFDGYSSSIRLNEPETAAVLGLSPATLKSWRLNKPGRGPVAVKTHYSIFYTAQSIREYQARANPA